MTNAWLLAKICLALMAVESGNCAVARNGECVGVLQLKPCYVAEANRIIGRNEFTYSDRLDEQRSIMMWWIVNLERRPASIIEAASIHKTGHRKPGPEDLDYIERVINLTGDMK